MVRDLDVLSVGEVSILLGVCERTVYRLVATGDLKCIRIRRRIKFLRGDIDEYLLGLKGE